MREHLVISQFAPGTPSQRTNFPRRNRTMALLTDATVIIEAGESSGTLHQGWEALRLGRPLFLMESITKDPSLRWPAEMIRYGPRFSLAPTWKRCSTPSRSGPVGSLLSSLPFAALLTYSPRGQSGISQKSRRVRDAIKAARLDLLERSVQKLLELGGMEPFLGADVVLVPAPRSAPIRDATTLWPARRICAELVAGKLGREVLPCLTRTMAVPKSAFAAVGERPDARRHFETMAVESSLSLAKRITVVDDVITKGATLLAAASRVQEAFPEAEVRAFALLRTMGLVEEVEGIVDPCTGTVVLARGEAVRAP